MRLPRFAAGVAAGILVVAAGAARADTHKDADTGFSVNVPKGWRQMPIAGEEKYIVAKYIGDRDLMSKKDGYPHRPEMKVILFPAGEKKGLKVTESDEGIVLRFNNPYKNYKEFLKDNSYGGYYVSKEEEGTVNGVACTKLEVKFEKLTTPRRLVAWVFHAEDADYAMSFEVLEDYWDKESPEYVQCLKTFKLFPRAKGLRATTGDDVVFDDITKLTPEQRVKRRIEKFDRHVQTEIERLPEGWRTKRSANFVGLTHVDDKYTQRVLDQAECVRAWLERTFAWYGTGIPGPVMIRICKDRDELAAYRDTSGMSGFLSEKAEITIAKDLDAGKLSMAFQTVNRQVMDFWMRDKNPQLHWALPMWVEEGLDQFVMTGTAKGKSLEFQPDAYEMDSLRETGRAGKLSTARDMMLATWREFFDNTEHGLAQAGALVRFLLDGPGAKGKSKDAFMTYLKSLVAFIREKEEAEKKADGSEKPADAPKTEEEEEKRFKETQDKWKQREKELLQGVFDRAFGSWSDADWKSFEAAYLRFVS